MKIMVVAATWMEVKPLEEFLLQADENGMLRQHQVELMITGPGLMATSFQLGRNLPAQQWDLLIHAGICGSFSQAIGIGEVVHIVTEELADFGAEDDEIFLDAFEIGLIDKNRLPFTDGRLKNIFIPRILEQFPAMAEWLKRISAVNSISVNKVHGNVRSILRIQKKYNAQVETMEGAAVHYACQLQSQPFLHLRSVSNLVERRNKAHWNIPLAVSNLNQKLIELIQRLLENEHS